MISITGLNEKALSILELAEQKQKFTYLIRLWQKNFEGAESKIFAIAPIPDEYEGLDQGLNH